VKERDAALFLVAHVTKDGLIAGPKTLEHIVDTVLYFEQNDADSRFLRAAKNRFGSVDEIGLFTMGEKGLQPVDDPSTLFLVNREGELPPGIATAAVLEGSRTLLVEIQALAVPAKGAMSRVFSDRIDAARVSRVAATLEKHLKLRLSDHDLYVNVAGGIRITEVGVELALAAALHSARTAFPFPPDRGRRRTLPWRAKSGRSAASRAASRQRRASDSTASSDRGPIPWTVRRRRCARRVGKMDPPCLISRAASRPSSPKKRKMLDGCPRCASLFFERNNLNKVRRSDRPGSRADEIEVITPPLPHLCFVYEHSLS
jgi:hypothetical protein